jgi:predicted permease
MGRATRTTRFRFWFWLIALIGATVPRRLRADWKQEWDAELRHRELLLSDWDKLNWKGKCALSYRSLGAFWDALWLQQHRWEDEMIQDLRYGVRMLLRHKGFTLVAALSLALGIGANTAIFSLIDAVLLKMLPVERPEQLYFVQNVGPQRPTGGAPPYPCFERFRERDQFFSGLAAFTRRDPKLTFDGQVEQVSGQFVSGNYFELLGVNPLLGRVISPADDEVPEKGGADGLVAVISYEYWTRRFARSPDTIGKVVQIGNDAVTIVGVTPPEFYGLFPGTEIDISLPIVMEGAPMLAEKSSWWFQAVGRLKPDASVDQARAELDAIFQPFMDETTVSAEMRAKAFARIELAPASKGLDTLRRQFSRPLQALMVIVGLVLLIACANVANLMLVRAAGRRKEFAVRLALGATRLRLLRQMLTESLLLVSLGGLLGLLFARWGGTLLVSFFTAGSHPLFVKLTLDHRVLLFTAGVALLTGLIFGLTPALQATRVDPAPALKDSAGSGARSRARFGRSLVVTQVALSLLLLIGAGLFLQTLRNLKNIDAGFRRDGVMTMRVFPPGLIYKGARLVNLWTDILGRVESLPGLRSASLSTLSPLDGSDRGVRVNIAGFTPSSESDTDIRINQVSPGFFPTFGIPLIQGRAFLERDTDGAPRVALLNETAARFYFGDGNPVGAQLKFDRGPNTPAIYQVIGVVKDSRYLSLREPDTRLAYLPMLQPLDRLGRLTLAVQADGRPADLINSVRAELRAAGSDILLTNVASMNDQVDQSLLQERLVATLSLFFGLLALLLACIGLYGVMSYNVARRTHEIGIRMALGASAPRIVGLVLRETMSVVSIGMVLGLGASLAVARLVATLLYGLAPNDPLTIALSAGLLLAVATVAGWLPARSASRVDPMVALRRE